MWNILTTIGATKDRPQHQNQKTDTPKHRPAPTKPILQI